MIERRYRRLLPVLLATASVAWAADGVPLGVSPGTPDVATTVATACPAFSWGGSADVGSWELVVYRAEEAATDREPVLRRRLPGGASSWTPALEQCLPAGGSFAWTVGAFIEGREPVFSRPLFFRTPAAPTVLELERALAVLEAWRQARGDPAEEARGSDGSAAAHRRPPAELPEGPGTSVAIRGASADTGVVGIGVEGTSASAEPGSAGLVGASSAATGDVAGLRASHQSPNGTAAELQAPNGGDLLRGSGPAGEVFSVDAAGALTVTSLSGDGSGLTGVDADTLEGNAANAFADAAHSHSGADITSGTVAEPRIDALLTRDLEVLPIVLSSDGPGSGLDADTLDGLEATEFASETHDHVGEVWTGSAGDYGLRVDNESPTGIGGLYGRSTSPSGTGVFGFGDATGGTATGVLGLVNSPDSRAGWFVNLGGGVSLAAGNGPEPSFQVSEAGDVVATSFQGDGSGLTGILPGPHTHLGEAWTGPVGTGLLVSNTSSGGFTLGVEGRSFGTSGIGVLGHEHATSGRTRGVAGVADSPAGFGGFFTNTAGGDHLAAGDTTFTPDFRVTGAGDVVATGDVTAAAYQGDGSQLTGVVTAGQSCSPGQVLVGIQADGSLQCGFLPIQTISTFDTGPGIVGYYSSIAIGSDGLPIVSHHDFSNKDLEVAHCDDVLCTSATTHTVDGVGTGGTAVGAYSSIAIRPGGLPIISYYDEANRDLKVALCEDVECSSATFRTLDTIGDVGRHTSIVIGVDGLPIVSYYDATNGDLKVAKCTVASCSSALVTTLQSVNDVGTFTSITLGVDSLPIISYSNETVTALETVHCDDIACSQGVRATVDSPGVVGRYTSIAIGSDGLPVISYHDATQGTIDFAHCENLLCTAVTLESVDFIGPDTEGYSSVTIGTDGLPVISYYNEIEGENLMVAHCNDVGCASVYVETVDSTGIVGQHNSIAIGVDGRPVVSYHDAVLGHLKVAHCANATCS